MIDNPTVVMLASHVPAVLIGVFAMLSIYKAAEAQLKEAYIIGTLAVVFYVSITFFYPGLPVTAGTLGGAAAMLILYAPEADVEQFPDTGDEVDQG